MDKIVSALVCWTARSWNDLYFIQSYSFPMIASLGEYSGNTDGGAESERSLHTGHVGYNRCNSASYAQGEFRGCPENWPSLWTCSLHAVADRIPMALGCLPAL